MGRDWIFFPLWTCLLVDFCFLNDGGPLSEVLLLLSSYPDSGRVADNLLKKKMVVGYDSKDVIVVCPVAVT